MRLTLLLLIAGASPVGGQIAAPPINNADSLQLFVAIYRKAIELGVRTAYAAALPRLVCLAQGAEAGIDPSPDALAALQSPDSLLLRPISECRLLSFVSEPRDTPLLSDAAGRRGIRVSASDPVFGKDGGFTVSLGYYEHGLSAARWTCGGRREATLWKILSCEMVWIS